jgi:hypothetical protein
MIRMKNGYTASAAKPNGGDHLGKPRANGSVTKMDLKETEYEELVWIKLG